MKKIVSLTVVLAVTLSMGSLAFADSLRGPAQTYADVAEITVEKAFELRGTDKTFGQLAQENNLLEDFRKANIESKKAILAEMVKKNQINQELADQVIKSMEDNNCITPGENRIGQKLGIGFGRNMQSGQGQGLRKGHGFGKTIGQGRNGAGLSSSN